MYNKKTLSDIVKNLGSAKAPTKKQDIIYDPMGQWTNPGQDTRVPTPNGNITMGANPETGQPIPFPVFAQPNVGPGVMMQPGQDYTFPGAEYVDEFPQVKKGGLVKQPKKYSKSLMAKNILFVKNAFINKKKSVKNKIFDPNSPYFEDGGTFEIELDDAEIDQYKQGGYIVEELDAYAKGGSSSCPKDHVWDSNTKKCVKVYTLANDKKLIDGVSNWAMQSNDPDKITPEYNDQIKHYLYSGVYGYDPITGTLHKLPKDQKTVADAETKKILAKQDDKAAYTQSIIDAGFDPDTFGKSKGTNVITGEEIYGDKSQEDVDKINKEAVSDFVTEGHRKAILESPFNTAAFFTPAGMAAGVMQGAANLLPDAYDFAKDPSWSGAGAVGMDALMMSPVAKGLGKALSFKGVPKELPGSPNASDNVQKAGFLNPLALIDRVTPRLPSIPTTFPLGIEDDIVNWSPLNLIPKYGKRLAEPGFTNPMNSKNTGITAYRKFGNSLDDLKNSKTFSPQGGFRMGAKQIQTEGNWAEPGIANEHYKGVFAAGMNPRVPGTNIELQAWHARNGVVGRTKQGNPAIPITDPGLDFHRRLPFSNKYVPINKQKLIDNKFQLATQLPHVQSLIEKYGIAAGYGLISGYLANGKEGAVENLKTINKYSVDPIINWSKTAWGDLENKLNQKEEGGHIDLDLDEDQINEYKEGGYIVEDISIPSLTRMDNGAQVKGSQGLNADFSTSLTAFINAAKADGIDLGIGSGFRSVEKQKQLWEQALKKYGTPEKARKWVAPPGRSNHNRGTAVDLNSSGAFLGKNKNTKATEWAHANAEKYGLHFRMGHEPWHIEPLNLSKEQKAKIDAEHQHSDSEDPNTHVDPNNVEALSKEGIDMTKYYKNLEKEQEITDIDNDYSNWNPQEEVVVDPRIAQLEAYSKLMSPSIQNVNDMYAATKVNQQQQQKQFAKGGHIELDADDSDINNYIKDGYFVEEVSSSSLPQNKNGGLNTFAVGGGGPCPKGQEWDEASQSCIDVLPEPKETLVPMVSAVPVEQPIQPVVETIQPETTVELNDNTVIKAPIVNNIETNEEKINAPSKNNYVIDTQRKLKSAGYDIGKSGPKGDGVDGIMGNRTRLALDAYNTGISPSKVKIPDPNVKIKGQVNDYKINSNIKDGYLPYLAKGVENCTKGKGCSANVSIKMSNLLGNITDESLWANDAWFNKSEVLNKGGDLLYENNEKDFSKMQNVPKDVWSKLQVGDYVELNRTNTNSSARFASQTKEGLKNEGIEHLGFVVGKDKDGTPLVWHGSETGKAYVQRIDQPLVLHDENKLTNSNTFTYKVSSIVRASALKNADFSGLQNSAYYTTLDPNKKLIPKKGATETQIQAVTTLNNSINKFKNLGYSQDDANYVGRLLIGGIMSNESKAGESLKRIPKEIAATIWKDYLGQGAFEGDEASIGYYQMKPNYNFTNKDGSLNPLGKKLEKLGVNVNDIESSDIDLQTKAGTLILLDNYTKLKEDPDFNVKTGLYKGKIPASYILAKSWQAGQDWYKRDKYKTFLNNFDVDYSNAAIENAINSIDSPYASRSLTNEYYKVTQYRAQKDKELQNKSKQETLKKITEQNKKEDAYIEANPNFRYEKQVPTESTAINKTYVKPINIPDYTKKNTDYTKKKIIPGTIYKYAQRPGVKYKKDANGKWYVNSGKASDNKYVLMVDPSGQRAKVLEKGAQPFYSKDGGFITSLSKEEIDRYINGGYIDTELTDKEITNYKNGGYIVEYLD
jgi:hypothetical protein